MALVCAFCIAFVHSTFAQADEPAGAPDPREQAAELKRKGDAAMESMQYADALADYDAAWALVEDPALLYNRARARQLLGDYPGALELLEAFSARAPADLRARVQVLDSLIAEVRGRVATLAISSNVKGARLLLGDKRIGTTPLAGPLRVNAGRAVLEVEADGYFPWKRELRLTGGGTEQVEVKLFSKKTTGVLVVTSPAEGARVSVDGKSAGNVPIDLVLAAGVHRVALRRDGYEDAETRVLVAAGERRQVSVPLERTRPVTQRWWFWTSVGAVVVGGTALTVALLTEKSAPSGNIDPGKISAPLVRWR